MKKIAVVSDDSNFVTIDDKRIPIHSILKTIQGEAINIGKPAILIRVMGCNLTCPWCDVSDSSWRIDKSKTKYLTAEEIIKILEEYGKNIDLLLITGGEPTQYFKNPAWKDITSYWVNKSDTSYIDIETNGTFSHIYARLPELLKIKDSNKKLLVNISPKLYEYSFKNFPSIGSFDDIIDFYKERIGREKRYSWNFRYLFKFVYNPYDKENEYRIKRFIEELEIDNDKVYILPLTPDESKPNFKEKFIDIQLKTLDWCIENGYTFIPRLHIYFYKLFSNKEYEYHKII